MRVHRGHRFEFPPSLASHCLVAPALSPEDAADPLLRLTLLVEADIDGHWKEIARAECFAGDLQNPPRLLVETDADLRMRGVVVPARAVQLLPESS